MVNSLAANEPPPAASTASNGSRSTTNAGGSTHRSRSHHSHHGSRHPGSSASSVASSVSSSSTTATSRAPSSGEHQLADKDKRRPSRVNTSSSSVSSSASSSAAAVRARMRRDDPGSVGTIREDAVATDIGPEKFAVKVSARERIIELSSSSSGPGSDKDDTSPQQPSKSGASSGSVSSSSATSHSTSKPSRMIVKRRTLGSSHSASVASSSIPNNSATPLQPQKKSTTPRTLARKVLRPDPSDEAKNGGGGGGEPKPRPVRIKYEAPTRGLGGGKREISHASLGKLIARLTDAQQYDTEFRDVFLLTYRCFCSPYDFVKKLVKRYNAVLALCANLDPATLLETQALLDQIAEEEENDRSSTATSLSTARSDINTGMEANVSIMRLLSVLKFWIKESGFIEMDLHGDRRSQKKLLTFLSGIQSTSPVASIRKHAENLLLMVAQLVRAQGQQQQQQHTAPVVLFQASSAVVPPPPPALGAASASASSVTDSISGNKPRVVDERGTESSAQSRDKGLTFAISKLRLTRSSSDPKRERSIVKLKMKQGGAGDVFQLQPRPRPAEDAASGGGDKEKAHAAAAAAAAAAAGAPKMSRGVTIGSTNISASADAPPHRGLDESFQDSMYRSRVAAPRNSSRITYDNVEPLSAITPQELADQLTLVEAEHYFAKVSPRELTNKAWTRENKFKEAPHVMALIELFDATAEWVSSEILHPRLQVAERAKVLTLFIEAAENCYQMNNFNTLFEIFTGLSAPCIRQLTTTWGLVGANATEKYQFLHGICSTEDNYRNYRQQFGFAEGQPRLPCWFIIVKDLFQYEESMKSAEDGLINWQKFRRIHRVISEALDRQNLNYLPPSGASASAGGISRKGKGVLRHDRKQQHRIRHRLETIRKDSSVLYQLARNANTQESILFVNSLSEAGFL
ncbi:hypothetical protein PybrP1_003651 [[Pythium] brassicae (nom. inval.)]|nr:hypothetical protein PybrP1_003651 [[Pythium] brassicae (nom. inval.)]